MALSRRWKIVLWTAAGAFALLLIAAVVALLSLDDMARAAVEKGGSQALGVEVRVAGAQVSLFKGTVTLTELRVANPVGQGFRAGDFLTVGRVASEGDVFGAIRTGELHVKEIVIESPQFVYEDVKGLSNVEAIRRGMARSARPSGGGGESSGTVRLRIDVLKIRNATIRIVRDGREVGVFNAAEVEIPGICDQNGRGVEPDRVAGVVIERLFGNGGFAEAKDARKTPSRRSEPRHGK